MSNPQEQLSIEEQAKQDNFLKVLQTPQELKNWVYVYLDILLPFGTVDDDSNSSPGDAIWDAYCAYRDDVYITKPGYIWVSSRDGAKTISGSILNLLLVYHFKAMIAHLAAVKKQGEKCLEYTNTFLRKTRPYLERAGRKIISDSKAKIQIQNEDNSLSYIDVIIANLAGGNCIDPETVVYTVDGAKKAKEVIAGEKLLTWDFFKNEDVFVDVDGVSFTHKPARELVFDDGSNLVVSDDHLCFTQNGWVPASCVRLGDRFTPPKNEERIQTTPVIEEPKLGNVDQILYGTLLGDGCITTNRSKDRYHYTVSHSPKQEGYLRFIQKSLEAGGVKCNSKFYIPRKIHKGKEYQTLAISTAVNTKIDSLRKEWYPNGTKIVTLDILNKLTWEGIAYWFMDDASGNGLLVGNGKDCAYRVATCNFTFEENILIRDWFRSKGLDCEVRSGGNSSTVKYYHLRFTLAASKKITPLISPYFVNCLRYKLVSAETHGRTVDRDELCNFRGRGFEWSNKTKKKHFKTQKNKLDWIRQTKLALSSKVVKVNLLGHKPLIDLHIKTDSPHLHSFYANSHKLIHNSQRATVGSYDELDTLSPQGVQGYNEAKLIPTRMGGHGPLSIKYSTRKFAFGVFAQEIENVDATGEEIKKWNILELTEHCPTSKNKKDSGNLNTVFVRKKLPLKTYSNNHVESLQPFEQNDYQEIQIYDGCLSCPLASVCKGKLANRPVEDKATKRSILKSVDFTIRQFSKVNPDMGEAQLLCWRPSTSGLVFPRFNDTIGENVITLANTYELITAEKKEDASLEDIIEAYTKLELRPDAGLDWGFTHDSVIVVLLRLPSGYSIFLDTFATPGLETHEFADIALTYQEKYNIKNWYCDTSNPGGVKTFKKKGMRCPDFKKDIQEGISSLRGQILTTKGVRRLLILQTEENQTLIDTFKKHHFLLDATGKPTKNPSDDEYADRADSCRYIAQNVFGNERKKMVFGTSTVDRPKAATVNEKIQTTNERLMRDQVRKLINDSGAAPKTNSRGTFKWNF